MIALQTIQPDHWRDYLKNWTRPELQQAQRLLQETYQRVAARRPRTDFDTSEMEVLTDLQELVSTLLLPASSDH